MCDSKELKEFYLTVPTADNKAVTHTRLIHCESCGSGQYFEGMDVAGSGKVIYKYPPELDREKIVEELEEALANGEQNEDLIAKVRFSVCHGSFLSTNSTLLFRQRVGHIRLRSSASGKN